MNQTPFMRKESGEGSPAPWKGESRGRCDIHGGRDVTSHSLSSSSPSHNTATTPLEEGKRKALLNINRRQRCPRWPGCEPLEGRAGFCRSISPGWMRPRSCRGAEFPAHLTPDGSPGPCIHHGSWFWGKQKRRLRDGCHWQMGCDDHASPFSP